MAASLASATDKASVDRGPFDSLFCGSELKTLNYQTVTNWNLEQSVFYFFSPITCLLERHFQDFVFPDVSGIFIRQT